MLKDFFLPVADGWNSTKTVSLAFVVALPILFMVPFFGMTWKLKSR
jgi:hypothetical protein